MTDEVRGWLDALSDRAVVWVLLGRVLLAVSLTLWGAVMVRYTETVFVVLGATGVALVASLALLRLRGRP